MKRFAIKMGAFIALLMGGASVLEFPFIPYINEPLFKPLYEELNVSKYDLHIPALKYHGEYNLMAYFFGRKHFPGHKYKGYIEIDWKWNGERISKGDIVGDDVDPKDVRLFDSFLKYCKENDVKVILVFTPQYFQAIEWEKKYNHAIDIFHSFSEKYDIPFLDYSNDSMCYDTAYFIDTSHLNKTGAELFSLKLANDIKAQNLYNVHED